MTLENVQIENYFQKIYGKMQVYSKRVVSETPRCERQVNMESRVFHTLIRWNTLGKWE